MWTDALAPAFRSKFGPPQERTPPETEQFQPPVVASTFHDRPALVGSVSVMLTPKAFPAPLLSTVIV